MNKVFYIILLFAIPNTFLAQCQPGTAEKEVKVGDYTIHHKVSGDFISSVDGPGIILQSEDMDRSMSILKSMGIWIAGVAIKKTRYLNSNNLAGNFKGLSC